MNGPAWILLSIYKLNADTEQVLLGNRLFVPGELSRVGPAAAQGHYQQDCSGPGGSNMQTLLLLIQSPEVEVLGITVVSGNQWRDEEVAHTLRLLEIIGRTDIPVVPGAVFPSVRRHEETQLWQRRYGKVAFGAHGMSDGGMRRSSFQLSRKGAP